MNKSPDYNCYAYLRSFTTAPENNHNRIVRSTIILAVLILAILIQEGCKEEPSSSCALLEFQTISPEQITHKLAISGGMISSTRFDQITEQGVVWDYDRSPSIQSNQGRSINRSMSTKYYCTLTRLTAERNYFVRAYIINGKDTVYANEKEFYTPAGGSIKLADIDGNIYYADTIGSLIWMNENLAVTRYNDGTAIPNIKDPDQWAIRKSAAYCSYDNDSIKGYIYGYLYNFYAVTDDRKLCPAGWHVASDLEWQTLGNIMGGNTVAGAKLKEKGTTHWASPNLVLPNANNFCALPNGSLSCLTNQFQEIGRTAFWWSATDNVDGPYKYYMTFSNSGLYTYNGVKTYGYGVRCIKDQ
jgi:uncharacterized protein (TIGR02145 family)